MTQQEILSTLVATLALVISLVSLIRTRKTTEVQVELSRINAKLAEKQFDRLVKEEPLEGQPTFAIYVTSIGGFGDFSSPNYEVRIRFRIDNTGGSYIKPLGIALVTLDGGIYKKLRHVEIEYKENRREIEGEHLLKVRPGADLLACSLHLQYVDNLGKDKIQEFRVFFEGDSECLPWAVNFSLSQVFSISPGSNWSLN